MKEMFPVAVRRCLVHKSSASGARRACVAVWCPSTVRRPGHGSSSDAGTIRRSSVTNKTVSPVSNLGGRGWCIYRLQQWFTSQHMLTKIGQEFENVVNRGHMMIGVFYHNCLFSLVVIFSVSLVFRSVVHVVTKQ